MNRYTYTPAHHLRYRMEERSEDIPENIMMIITQELHKNGVTNPDYADIKVILREHELYKYFTKVNNILRKIHNNVINTEPTECVICFETVTKMVRLKCHPDHMYCESCANSLNKSDQIKCPLCRQDSTNIKQLDDKDKIVEYFKEHQDEFKIDDNRYMPFEKIIDTINNVKH